MNAESRNSYQIQNSLRSIRVEQLFPGAKVKPGRESVATFGSTRTDLVVSDASDTKAAIIELEGGERREMSFSFSAEERKMSSGHRELLSIKKALTQWNCKGVMKRKKIFWATDSTNVIPFKRIVKKIYSVIFV
jgi:hypothetical protein